MPLPLEVPADLPCLQSMSSVKHTYRRAPSLRISALHFPILLPVPNLGTSSLPLCVKGQSNILGPSLPRISQDLPYPSPLTAW